MNDDPPELLDLVPRLKRKLASECKHRYAEVDDEAASLTCVDCGAELDPWWYIRQLARDADADAEERRVARAHYEQWCAQANAKVARLQGEIAELTNAKNRLWNEQVNGAPLGSQVRRRRSQ